MFMYAEEQISTKNIYSWTQLKPVALLFAAPAQVVLTSIGYSLAAEHMPKSAVTNSHLRVWK